MNLYLTNDESITLQLMLRIKIKENESEKRFTEDSDHLNLKSLDLKISKLNKNKK